MRSQIVLCARSAVTAIVLSLAGSTSLAHAQKTPQRPAAGPSDRSLTIRITRAPLESVLRLIEGSLEARINPMWADAEHAEGLSSEMLVDLDVQNAPFSAVLDRVASQADQTVGGGTTWQVTDDGSIQIGPRSRLNAYRRVVVYDIRDLLFQVKDSREAATIDLQAALQASQGSGSSTPAIREPQDRQESPTLRDPPEELVELLTQFIDPEQWESNGGTGASFRVYQKSLVVRAPGYIHRQISGERYLPRR